MFLGEYRTVKKGKAYIFVRSFFFVHRIEKGIKMKALNEERKQRWMMKQKAPPLNYRYQGCENVKPSKIFSNISTRYATLPNK